MNRKKAKILKKAARILATGRSKLHWETPGNKAYRKDSPRAVYQRLKREARDPDRYMQLKLIVGLSAVGKTAAEAGKALRQVVNRVGISLEGVTTGRIPSDRPNMSNSPKSQ